MVYQDQSPDLCQSCSETLESLEGGLHPLQGHGRHPVLSPGRRVSQYCGLNPDWSTLASQELRIIFFVYRFSHCIIGYIHKKVLQGFWVGLSFHEYSLTSQCQNSSKFLSVAYFMKTPDVIMFFFSSSHYRTNHTC